MAELQQNDKPLKVREVRITIQVVGPTDRDAWEWGEAIARGLKADFADGGEEFGPMSVECVDVEHM